MASPNYSNIKPRIDSSWKAYQVESSSQGSIDIFAKEQDLKSIIKQGSERSESKSTLFNESYLGKTQYKKLDSILPKISFKDGKNVYLEDILKPCKSRLLLHEILIQLSTKYKIMPDCISDKAIELYKNQDFISGFSEEMSTEDMVQYVESQIEQHLQLKRKKQTDNPKLKILSGPPGSGKGHFIKQKFTEKDILNASHINIDLYRKALLKFSKVAKDTNTATATNGETYLIKLAIFNRLKDEPKTNIIYDGLNYKDATLMFLDIENEINFVHASASRTIENTYERAHVFPNTHNQNCLKKPIKGEPGRYVDKKFGIQAQIDSANIISELLHNKIDSNTKNINIWYNNRITGLTLVAESKNDNWKIHNPKRLKEIEKKEHLNKNAKYPSQLY